MPNSEPSLTQLLSIISRLRAPDGCPWDRKQTPQSFKSYLIEEAHELLEAVDRGDPSQVKEELGDLLFQVAFLSRLFEEKQQFTFTEVIQNITEKMIRRHPHVFGGIEAGSQEEMRRRWQEIKAQEKKDKSEAADFLAAVPRSLPALRRAQRVFERAGRGELTAALEDLEHQTADLKNSLSKAPADQVSAPLGQILLTLARVGRLTATNTEDALHEAVDGFIAERKGKAGAERALEPTGAARKISP